MRIKLLAAAASVFLLARVFAGSQEAPRPAQVEWLMANAIPFETAEAGTGFADLEPLRAIIGDARIVALGEGTHGTREFFRMKHRLTEFLASEMGFTIFSIEASTPEAFAVSDYVVRATGDPARLVGGMYFWTWNTEEVLDMVRWMREFNLSGKGSMEFTGFDMQTPDVAMRIVGDFVSEVDPERAAAVRAKYRRIREAQRSGTFGVTTFRFPVEQARGKRVRFSGFIRTEDLSSGWAGLWWRVDGDEGGEHKTLAFDNMARRGPRGTTEWTEYTVELDVSEEAVNINFGVLMPGNGKAWFDGLRVELDGDVYGGEEFDLDFEGGRIRGYASRDGAYLASLDSKQAHSGNQSLKIESLESDPDSPSASEAARVAGEVLSDLQSSRPRYLEKRSAQEVDWVLHNARIVDQCMRARAGSGGLVRDESMAANVVWILDQNPGARIVLWAHNGHISRRKGAMGAHLFERHGEDYLTIAFAAGTGEYYAVGDGSPGNHRLQPPPPRSVESFFAATGQPRLILDLRRAARDSEDSRWLTESRPFRSIGAVATEEQFYPAVITDLFDVLIYFDATTPARQLDTPPRRSRAR
jgi:erythromycin esterase-like protein